MLFLNLSHVGTLQNEVKSCNLRADLGTTNFLIHMRYDWHSLVLVIFVIINGRGIMQMPRAQIINFENNRNISKSVVFVSLLIHYFATCICSNLWYMMRKP